MATITINVRDDVAVRFRKKAAAAFGGGKGHLGKAVEAALDEWTGRDKNVEARALELLDRGFAMGGFVEKDRAKWHDR